MSGLHFHLLMTKSMVNNNSLMTLFKQDKIPEAGEINGPSQDKAYFYAKFEKPDKARFLKLGLRSIHALKKFFRMVIWAWLLLLY